MALETLSESAIKRRITSSRPLDPLTLERPLGRVLHSLGFQVVKMMMIVVMVFGVCWLPYQVYFIALYVFPNIVYSPYIQVSERTYSINSISNGFIHNLANPSGN